MIVSKLLLTLLLSVFPTDRPGSDRFLLLGRRFEENGEVDLLYVAPERLAVLLGEISRCLSFWTFLFFFFGSVFFVLVVGLS